MNTIQQIESVLIRLLYWVCRVAASPLLVFYFVYRCARDRRYLRQLPGTAGRAPGFFFRRRRQALFGCTRFRWEK